MFFATLLWVMAATPLLGQRSEPHRSEEVTYRNAQDSMVLSATLHLPGGDGPHPGVVLLSIAGTGPLVDELTGRGYAVLTPVRRGFVDVEPLLQATFADLAGDVRAAIRYLGMRPDVRESALGVVAQADDAPPAMLESVGSEAPVPLILMAPPAFPGTRLFHDEQHSLAQRDGAGPSQLEALDRYVEAITGIVLSESTPFRRAYGLEGLRAASDVELPRNAAFPADERQVDFFASPLWHDRLAFQPEAVFAGLRAPTLVLIGTDDPNTPLEEYLATVRRGLAGGTSYAVVCLVPGRTRHMFTDAGVHAIVSWLDGRLGAGDSGEALLDCLDENTVG